MVQRYLEGLPDSEIERLRASVGPYLQFRSEVARFQREFLSEICTQACFTARQCTLLDKDRTLGERWEGLLLKEKQFT